MSVTLTALVQFASRLGDLPDNVERHAARAAQAAREGAALAVFPELSLTGYLVKDAAAELARAPSDPVFAPLRRISKQIPVIAGAVEPAPEGVCNSVYLFAGGRGTVVHRKRFLPNYGMFNEARHFVPGPLPLKPCATPLGVTGVLVCEDAWHLECHLAIGAHAPDAALWLTASPLRGAESNPPASVSSWRDLAQVVARQLTTPILCVNRAGFEDGLGFSGCSFAVDAEGQVLHMAEQNEETLLLVEVDHAHTRRVRRSLPLLRDLDLRVARGEEAP